MKEKNIYPYLITKSLQELGYKEQFLSFVKDSRPEIYVLIYIQNIEIPFEK